MPLSHDLQALLAHLVHGLDRLSLVDYLVLVANLLLLLLARRILALFDHGDNDAPEFLLKLRVFRALNLLFFFAYGYLLFEREQGGTGLRLIGLMADIYLGYLAIHIADYFIRARFGRSREIEGQLRVVETYRTRLLMLLARALIAVVVLVAVVRTLGFESWLETGGVIGLIGVFIALTQAVWAPDLFSGLIMLNSGMLEEGDVIEIGGGEPLLGVVFKTKMFHTEVLNLVNNHRIMIRNSRLRDCVIHNLAKFASARGLREQLRFKIGYEVRPERVRRMFERAWACARQNPHVRIDWNHAPEIRVLNTGDYAVEWAVFYYTKDVKQILQTRQLFQECILDASAADGLALATPLLANLDAGMQAALSDGTAA